MYIYSSNPWESNHRDGPTAHKNKHNDKTDKCTMYVHVCMYMFQKGNK